MDLTTITEDRSQMNSATIPNDQSLMNSTTIPEGQSQADFIKNDLNFDVDPNDPLTKATLEDHPKDEWIDILGNGQLRKRVVTMGEKGCRPNRYDLCTLRMSGILMGNGKLVENIDKIVIQLGDVEVIQGLDLAIALMEVGEVAEIEVASRFAYGDTGLPPDIPPGATLLYTIELISIEVAKEIEELGFHRRRKIGNKKRERGNWWFGRSEPTLAIQCYRRALDFLHPTKSVSTGAGNDEANNGPNAEESVSDTDLQTLLEDRTTVYNNLAAAQIKIEAYDAALESVENVLRCQPQNAKALYRKGKIFHKKGEHVKAHATLLQASKFIPDSKAIQQELAILKRKTAKDTLHEKNLYRKMLGATGEDQKQQDQKFTKNNLEGHESPKGSGKIATWSLIGGAVAAVVAGIAYKFVF